MRVARTCSLFFFNGGRNSADDAVSIFEQGASASCTD
jgi:hypothetical protein